MWQYGQMIRALKFWSMTVFLYSYSDGAILYADFMRQADQPAQSGTLCCNPLLVSGGPRPYRSIHALSPNSLTAHLPPPPAVREPRIPSQVRGFHFVEGLHESFLQCGLNKGYLSLAPN